MSRTAFHNIGPPDKIEFSRSKGVYIDIQTLGHSDSPSTPIPCKRIHDRVSGYRNVYFRVSNSCAPNFRIWACSKQTNSYGDCIRGPTVIYNDTHLLPTSLPLVRLSGSSSNAFNCKKGAVIHNGTNLHS